MLIGFAVLTIAYMIPVLGFITWAITGAIGLRGGADAFRAALRREHPPRVRPPLTIEPAAVVEPRPTAAAEPAYDCTDRLRSCRTRPPRQTRRTVSCRRRHPQCRAISRSTPERPFLTVWRHLLSTRS